jgi:hypothetical protein
MFDGTQLRIIPALDLSGIRPCRCSTPAGAVSSESITVNVSWTALDARR